MPIKSKVPGKRGRKQKIHTAVSDFVLADAKQLYEKILKQIHAQDIAARQQARNDGRILSRAKKDPSMRAAEEVIRIMGRELGNISAKRLLNAFSETRYIDMKDEDYPEDPE